MDQKELRARANAAVVSCMAALDTLQDPDNTEAVIPKSAIDEVKEATERAQNAKTRVHASADSGDITEAENALSEAEHWSEVANRITTKTHLNPDILA